MNSGMAMRRIQVEAKDVIWPFVILMTINVAMLLGWSIVSPLQYVRVPASNVDTFGRTLESHGQCKSSDNTYLFFLIPILLFDFAGLATATYQSYIARNLPTALSESSYLALAMASLLESFLLGGPIYFMVMNKPTASLLVGSSLLCVITMTILLPIFIPKYLNRHMEGTAGRAGSLVSSRIVSSSGNLRATPSSRSIEMESKRGVMYISRRGVDSEYLGSSRALNTSDTLSVRASSHWAPNSNRGSSQHRASGLESVAENRPF